MFGTTCDDYGIPYDGTVSGIDVTVTPDSNPIMIYADYEASDRCRVKLYQ
ncbi:MAG: hypothetical protein JXQ30_13385 [Spirochaetes bacterium]|nr:hypothetical protein [Spirochaetota bacterium]